MLQFPLGRASRRRRPVTSYAEHLHPIKSDLRPMCQAKSVAVALVCLGLNVHSLLVIP